MYIYIYSKYVDATGDSVLRLLPLVERDSSWKKEPEVGYDFSSYPGKTRATILYVISL